MSIEIKNVSKTIKKVQVLKDVSVNIENGRVVALSGPNGSGKTMLMRLVVGLMTANEGIVVVDGERIGIDCAFPKSVGMLIENPQFLNAYSGRTNLSFLASIHNRINNKEIIEVLEKVGLDPNDKRSFRKYSLGMKQRLGLAAAVMERPSTILLDEPSNALDSEGSLMLKELILEQRNRGASILWACHDRDLMREISDEVYYLEEGLVCGHEFLKEIES